MLAVGRLRFIGDLQRLPEELRALLREAAEHGPARGEERLLLCVALSYGGRQEIAQVARLLAMQAAEGGLLPNDIDEARFADTLHSLPNAAPSDPDLLIRTGGQHRLSNFLLFQAAYTELYVTDVLWPDFSTADLELSLNAFGKRKRTFGKRIQQDGD